MRVPNESGRNGGPHGLSQHTSSSWRINQLTLSFNWDLSLSSSRSSNPVRIAVSCVMSGVSWLMLWCVSPTSPLCPANRRWRCGSLPQVGRWGDNDNHVSHHIGLLDEMVIHQWAPLHAQLAKRSPACWGPSMHGGGCMHPCAHKWHKNLCALSFADRWIGAF